MLLPRPGVPALQPGGNSLAGVPALQPGRNSLVR
jgi:hypothetical protein